MKELKSKRLNLSMTDELHAQITEEADRLGLSLSAYCIQAIEKSLGKVQKIDPKFITVEPIDIYTDDVREGLNKIGNTAAKLDRLMFTLSQKGNVADYELKRLSDLTAQLKDEEREFNQNLVSVYEERVAVRKEAVKKIEKLFKKATGSGPEKMKSKQPNPRKTGNEK